MTACACLTDSRRGPNGREPGGLPCPEPAVALIRDARATDRSAFPVCRHHLGLVDDPFTISDYVLVKELPM